LQSAVAIIAGFIFHDPLPFLGLGVSILNLKTTAKWSVNAAGTIIILDFFV
jgi:hypothetical protein